VQPADQLHPSGPHLPGHHQRGHFYLHLRRLRQPIAAGRPGIDDPVRRWRHRAAHADRQHGLRTALLSGAGRYRHGALLLRDDVSNPQGTSQESVNASTLAQKRRYYDPYGNPVGTIPGSWPDNHAFLGQPGDAATGYDLLGARQYNPVTGAFLSLDPDFQPGDPLAMGGYAYADDNPATNTDPAGTMCVPGASANGNCNDQPTQENGDGSGSGGSSGGYSGGGYSYGGGYTTVGTVVLPASYPHVKEIKKIFNQMYRGGIKANAWAPGQSTEYKALLLACQSNQSICGSTLMNALYRGGPDGTAMTIKDDRAWQSSGESQAAWLYTHGQQMVLQNSAMVSATVFAGVLANRALGKMAEAASRPCTRRMAIRSPIRSRSRWPADVVRFLISSLRTRAVIRKPSRLRLATLR
jgi:RHS repeat-associated protein